MIQTRARRTYYSNVGLMKSALVLLEPEDALITTDTLEEFNPAGWFHAETILDRADFTFHVRTFGRFGETAIKQADSLDEAHGWLLEKGIAAYKIELVRVL